ncbi:hypothetical protein PENTCL1PPCAC_30151, partial [Pristionchus entomophagus]
ATLLSLAIAIAQPSCNGHECPVGKRCVMQTVQCFAPPCDPLPTCVSDSTECVPPCPSGQKCLSDTMHCLNGPCPPAKPRCMSVGNSTSGE